MCAKTNKAFAIECKYQDSQGTVDEKIPYALDDLKALPLAAGLKPDTRDLDRLLAALFGWWDVLVENKPPVVAGEARQPRLLEDEQPV